MSFAKLSRNRSLAVGIVVVWSSEYEFVIFSAQDGTPTKQYSSEKKVQLPALASFHYMHRKAA